MSQAAQTLELCHLIFHVHHGKILAVLPKLYRRNSTIFHANGFHCLQFNRQAVGIPAGNVGCTIAAHVFVLDNKILQRLVQCSSQVNLTIGIGRAVMKNITGLSFILGND